MKNKLRHPKFVTLHGIALLVVLFLPLFLKIVSWFSSIGGGCIMRRFFIYCPLCGGTRALSALIRFDFVSAWNYNAFVVLLAFTVLVLDVWAWVRYFQKKEPLIILPKWSLTVFSAVFLTYFVLRNCLMIFFGIDPTGNLGYFWDAVRALRG